MPAVKRFELCAGCRNDKDGLAQLKRLFEDTSTTSSDLIAYLKQSPLRFDVIQQFFALPATDNKVVYQVYRTGLSELICTDCLVLMENYRADYVYIHAFEASLVDTGELDNQTFKAISLDLSRGAKATLEEFRSNEWFVPEAFAQILNDPGVFNEFASDAEFEEVDRKRLRNALGSLLKFEGHWDDDGECLSGDAGANIFYNVKSALAILDKPTRKAKKSKLTSLNFKQKPEPKVADAFTVLATSKSVDDRTLVASEMSISLYWLKVLSKDKSEYVRHAIAGNLQATPAILKVLGRDKSEYVVTAVGSNPSTPAVTLRTLARARSEDIRQSVACNEKVPVQILRLLAKDDWASVRAAVARQEKTPKPLLMVLSRDSEEDVRNGVAGNPQAPSELLESLSREDGFFIRWTVASNPSTPMRILRRLWRDEGEDWNVRTSVAENPSISKNFLLEILDESKKLKRNRSRYVSAIAGNRKTPVDVLVVLAKDKDKWVRTVVAENTNTPQETLRVLALERLPKGKYITETNVRAAVAGNPLCPVDLLESLAKDKSAGIRWRVAGNPSTNAETLMLLARDSDEDVRGAVQSNASATLEIKVLANTFKFPISD